MIEVHLEIFLFVQKMAHGGGAEADVGKGGGGGWGRGGWGRGGSGPSTLRDSTPCRPFELF